MFRFSVLLAFIFAFLFGPSKATPLKKKNLRRRVRAPAPPMTNGLAALDASHLASRGAVGYHDYTTDSSSSDDGHHHRHVHHHSHGHRHHRRPKKGKRRFKYIYDCCRKCRHCGSGFSTESPYDSSPAKSSASGESTESDVPRPTPMSIPPTPLPPPKPDPVRTPPPTRPAPSPSKAPKVPPVLTTSHEENDSGFTSGSSVPPPPAGNVSSSDSDYGYHYHSGCH